jgi:hypothetical protein
MIKQALFLIAFLLMSPFSKAQKWVDSSYAIQITQDLVYGTTSPDFAGNPSQLSLDIATPIGDSIPDNGRPLLVAIHGGAFMAGSKNDFNPQKWMKDFAAKGYTTASVNYRLGMFQTHQNRNCNITWIFNTPWNCANVADTSEWYRSYFRGVQDVKGAIRYLISNKDIYHINPEMVFLIGESAGGYIAMGTGFLDTVLEKSSAQFEIDSVLRPNNLYESCSPVAINSMQLQRPDLGNIDGGLNVFVEDYKIKGVANFYGGILNNLFEHNTSSNPELLYLFHQPNDLIVPYDYDQILEGYSNCAQSFGGCANIISRPYTYGSFGIKKLIDSLQADGAQNLPTYVFESTNNNADCLQQINTGYLGGHQIDNYETRTQKVAELFANCINGTVNSVSEIKGDFSFEIYPNPAKGFFRISTSKNQTIKSISVLDLTGKSVFRKENVTTAGEIYFNESQLLNQGIYIIQVEMNGSVFSKKLFVIRE